MLTPLKSHFRNLSTGGSQQCLLTTSSTPPTFCHNTNPSVTTPQLCWPHGMIVIPLSLPWISASASSRISSLCLALIVCPVVDLFRCKSKQVTPLLKSLLAPHFPYSKRKKFKMVHNVLQAPIALWPRCLHCFCSLA